MAAMVQDRLLTAEELFSIPDDDNRYELVRGKLVCMAAGGGLHGKIASRVDHRLRDFVEAHGLGEVCTAETGFRLAQHPDTVRAPDVAFVARERISAEGVPEGYWSFAPDLAVEVISPSDRFDDVLTKIQEYLNAGSRLVWVVHPRTQAVMVYHPTGEVQLLRGQDELSGEDVLPEFRCRVEEIFA